MALPGEATPGHQEEVVGGTDVSLEVRVTVKDVKGSDPERTAREQIMEALEDEGPKVHFHIVDSFAD